MPDPLEVGHLAARFAIREEFDGDTCEGLALPDNQLVIAQIELIEVTAGQFKAAISDCAPGSPARTGVTPPVSAR
jgi:hypothetical protein